MARSPVGAAERTLDGEDHFGTIGEGENIATIPGAEVGRAYRNNRDPLHQNQRPPVHPKTPKPISPGSQQSVAFMSPPAPLHFPAPD
jgi:hypothetical protein